MSVYFNLFGKSTFSILSLKTWDRYWENIVFSISTSLCCAAPRDSQDLEGWKEDKFWKTTSKTTHTSSNTRKIPVPLNRLNYYCYCMILLHDLNSFFGLKNFCRGPKNFVGQVINLLFLKNSFDIEIINLGIVLITATSLKF